MFQPTALYLALVALITLRYFASTAQEDPSGTPRNWLRDVGIAVAIGAVAHLLPVRSPLMSVLMMLAYLVGFMVLTLWLYRRFGKGGGSIAGRILVIMLCLVGAMIAMALPILVLAKFGLPVISGSAPPL